MELQHQEMELLIIRHLAGETSAEEEARLQEWLNATTENKLLYTQLADAWMAADLSGHKQNFDTDFSWKIIQRKLKLTPENTLRPVQKVRFFRYAAAAAIFLFIALGALWLYRYSEFSKPDMAAVYATDSTRYVRLPDGSEVWLNRGTSLRYPARFSTSQRQVQLSGEAFFSVVHRDNQPFEVQTENSMVKVLGTSFDVKAFEGSAHTSVLVETGRVRLSSSLQKNISMVLEKGELGEIDHASRKSQVTISNDPNYLAWKTHRIRFINNDLAEVARVLHQVYGTRLLMEDKALEKLRFTAQYNEQEKLEDILETIAVSFNLRVEKTESGQYLLRSRSR